MRTGDACELRSQSHCDCGGQRTLCWGNRFTERVHHGNGPGSRVALKCRRENIRRSYRVLNREIDAYAADR